MILQWFLCTGMCTLGTETADRIAFIIWYFNLFQLSKLISVTSHAFVFIWGNHKSRGSYENPQSALGPVFNSGPMCNPMCVKCLCAWVVHGYCCSDSACCVCESFVLCTSNVTGHHREAKVWYHMILCTKCVFDIRASSSPPRLPLC